MLGFGLGLRPPHYDFVLSQKPKLDWFEVISENFFIPGGKPRRILRDVRRDYPVVLHGVSMSLGSVDPLDENYLGKLKSLVDEIQPAWFSDHLCWASLGGHYTHDLLPLPYNEAVVEHVAGRIRRVQDYFKGPMLVENVSSYLTYKASEMNEWEFLEQIVKRSGCKLLLDVNNIYVSSRNHGFDPRLFIQKIPLDAVGQIHLAGHLDKETHVIDTHDHPVVDCVWELYKEACERFGPVATMIERDDKIPGFPVLMAELDQAKTIQKEFHGKNR